MHKNCNQEGELAVRTELRREPALVCQFPQGIMVSALARQSSLPMECCEKAAPAPKVTV